MAEEQDNWENLDDDKLDDSSLDSFFEDLSSIDEPYSNNDQSKPIDNPLLDSPRTATNSRVKTTKKKSKTRWIILLLLLLAGVGVWFFMRTPSTSQNNKNALFPVSNLDLDSKEKLPTFTIEDTKEKKTNTFFQSSMNNTNTHYYVQVAICSFDSCIKKFSNKLQRLKEPVFYSEKKDPFDFIQVISRSVMTYEMANLMADRINRINKLTGHASIVSQTSGYRITMGTFTALDRAKELKNYLEKITSTTSQDTTQFNLEHIVKSYVTTKVLAGPYPSRTTVINAMKKLRNNQFQGAFVLKL